MKRKTLFGKLFPSYLAVIGIGFAAAAFLLRAGLKEHEAAQAFASLANQARLVAYSLETQAVFEGARERFIRELGRVGGARFTFIRPDGHVAWDSRAEASGMDDHASRPEIAAALAGSEGRAIRKSPTLGGDMLYVAVPVQGGVIRAAMPLSAFETELGRNTVIVLALLGGSALLACLAGFFSAWRIARPLEGLVAGVARMAKGESLRPLPVPEMEEAAKVALAVNAMAKEMDERMRRVLLEQSRQQAILVGMGAGVLALDRKQKLIFANTEAKKLLKHQGEDMAGRHILELSGNADLQSFVEGALGREDSLEAEIVMSQGQGLVYQARTAPLRGGSGEIDGVLVVLSDVTRLKRLEQARRDFAANASHELRTPITSIRGFAETLRHAENLSKEDERSFLDIILRQSARLEGLIGDLLLISRLENLEGISRDAFETLPVRLIAEASAQTCAPQAAAKSMTVTVDVEEGLCAKVHPEAMERALTNLIDNAVKYSPGNTTVTVRGRGEEGRVVLEVMDQGPGIEPGHLERVFERFYRVDAVRSRELGGTGLGLSIVKHAAQAHGGSVEAKSAPGKGSRFSIVLPR
jgi:two-component system phosphate regulon sensor histidine kinase PhoR